jgi:hypothetical protein
MKFEIKPSSQQQAVQKKVPLGFTLVELLVSMTITLVIVGLLMGMTKMAVSAWQTTHAKARSSRLAQEVFNSIGKDLEGMVIRTGNPYEWLLIQKVDDIDMSDAEKGPTGGIGNATQKQMVNPLEISFFSAVTDRYDGQINTAQDMGGDISMVRYRLIHQDLIDIDANTKPVFALYRQRINPDETFNEMLAKPTIDGIRDSSEIVVEQNYLAENIFDFTLSFNFEYKVTYTDTSTGIKSSRVKYKRVAIQASDTDSDSLSIKGNSVLVGGDSFITLVTSDLGANESNPSSPRLAGADVSILVLSDGGMNGLKNKNITDKADFAQYLKEYGHIYSKSVIVPRP